MLPVILQCRRRYASVRLSPAAGDQKARRIKIHFSLPGNRAEIAYRPRNKAGKAFDHVRGIAVSPTLTLLREIIVESDFPGDIRTYIKHFNGRLPNESEIKQIYAKRAMILQQPARMRRTAAAGTALSVHLRRPRKDRDYNYCLDFSTGKSQLPTVSGYVAAILVE